MERAFVLSIAAIASIVAFAAQPPVKAEPSRGELLYSTHCIACHTAQIHWRDKRLATDWTALKAQVRRWQSNVGLQWSDEDIVEVARHLNALYYRYPETGNQVGMTGDHDVLLCGCGPIF